MHLQLLNAKELGLKLSELMKTYDEYYVAVAWATHGELADLLLKNKPKIKQLLIGVSFCHTEPQILKRLQNTASVRVALGLTTHTFHPKVYAFIRGNKAAVVIGSANLTHAAMSSNIEASVLIEGDMQDSQIADTFSFINSNWAAAQPITQEFLTSYTLRFEATKRAREKLTQPITVRARDPRAPNPDLLELTWQQYVKRIEESPFVSLPGRLAMLSKARQILESKETFQALDRDIERKAIAGVITKSEKAGTDLEDYDWGWFGTMTRSTVYRNLISNNSRDISRALSMIPSIGEVTEQDYSGYIKRMKAAFGPHEDGLGLANATRMLAIKRPDYFVCVDAKNKPGLCRDLGIVPNRLTYDSYWAELIDPIIESTWWNATGPKGAIWEARAAMLDAIYYDPRP